MSQQGRQQVHISLPMSCSGEFLSHLLTMNLSVCVYFLYMHIRSNSARACVSAREQCFMIHELKPPLVKELIRNETQMLCRVSLRFIERKHPI